jgi:ribosomal protein L11 methyltransferase
VLAARTAPGGRVALAGILSAQADDVRAAYDAAFAIHTWRSTDDWVLLEGERRSAR